MLKTCRVLLILSLVVNSLASEKVGLYALSEKIIIRNYLKLHEESFRKSCQGKVDHIGEALYKSFLGDGTYIPFNLDGSLDKKAITNSLGLLKKREKWLLNLSKNLKLKKSFRSEIGVLRDLKNAFKLVQKARHESFRNPARTSRRKALLKSDAFVKSLELFLDDLIFFHSFKFPVDHFYLRAEYDNYRAGESFEQKHLKNEIYMLRKIVEEGAVDKKKGRSDLSLRALINTIYLRLSSTQNDFLSENLRYDIDSLFAKLEFALRQGKKSLLRKILSWHKSTKKRYKYYQKIVDEKKTKKDILKKIYSSKNKARYALRNFVYGKEAQVYKFWSKTKPLYQKLYALETILIHEVGRLDNSYGSERRDVAKVVINRSINPKYNEIIKSESLYPFLEKYKLAKNNVKFPWLNVLFKEGQFSFTYFFIPASRGIYCPDQSKRAKKLRRKNLSIILSELKKRDRSFKATRYFSRASMLGRIDMAQLWSEYVPLPESPGPQIKRSRKYAKLLKKKSLEFLYSFVDKRGQEFEAYRYKKTSLLYNPKLNKFYQYRNPHFFKYFQKEEGY